MQEYFKKSVHDSIIYNRATEYRSEMLSFSQVCSTTLWLQIFPRDISLNQYTL
jgi:hypothetical protein